MEDLVTAEALRCVGDRGGSPDTVIIHTANVETRSPGITSHDLSEPGAKPDGGSADTVSGISGYSRVADILSDTVAMSYRWRARPNEDWMDNNATARRVCNFYYSTTGMTIRFILMVCTILIPFHKEPFHCTPIPAYATVCSAKDSLDAEQLSM